MTILNLKLESLPGDKILPTAEEMVRIAIQLRVVVTLTFNEIEIEAFPWSKPEYVVQVYHERDEMQRAEKIALLNEAVIGPPTSVVDNGDGTQTSTWSFEDDERGKIDTERFRE